MSEETPEEIVPRQVHAVAVSANVGAAGTGITKVDAKFIELAMSQAVQWCYDNGITEPDMVREKMMTARKAAKRMILEGVTSQGNDEG